MKVFPGAGIIAALAAASAASGQARPELSRQVREFVTIAEPVVALTNVTLIDGTGRPAQRGVTVVLREGRIAAVGAGDRVSLPTGARVMDLTGHTVMPGMVGMHDHLFYTAAGGRQAQLTFSAPRLYLGAGVTTIRTTGSTSPYADINLKAEIERGAEPGPHIYITAPYITGGESPGDMAAVDSPEAARRFVAYWAEEGASWIKAYTDIQRADLEAAIDEAHRLGLKVTGHLCSVTFREAVALDIDNLEHGLLTDTDFDPNKEPDRCPPNSMVTVGRSVDVTSPAVRETIRIMVENGVSMTATPAVIEPFIPGRPVTDERTLAAMAPEVKEAYLQTRKQIETAGEQFPFQWSMLAASLQFEKAFVEAGGVLGAGVDPTGIGGALPGFGDQRNYELLVEAGFSAESAVRVLSANGARILGEDSRFGTVEVGKRADLVVMHGDLTTQPAVIRNVTVVFKDGFGYDSARLIAAVKGRVGIN